ncbi:MAG: hypothetical protein JWQ55_933, partial [Rhodopila sp.]|nr:hypothetical protein [Rhodopila sp.]
GGFIPYPVLSAMNFFPEDFRHGGRLPADAPLAAE